VIRAIATALALIPIGGGQHLDLSCKGTGSPTVVFESGLGVYSGTWLAVQRRVAKATRACIYDRRGLGASSPAPSGRTSADMVQDLETLLQNAKLTPPYVLVGASFGGLNVQLYAAQHPADVGGIVLIDSLQWDFDRRIEQLLPRTVALQRRSDLGLNQEHVLFLQILASEREVKAVLPLPNVPLVVIRHGLPFSTDPGWPTEKVEQLWLSLQRSLTREVSPAGALVPATHSSHRIAEQQPALVASEIVCVVTEARH
jgi:pimeloyl-ACP methyl ester carboxylesterase